MSLYTPINGFTKRSIKDHISREFKGKAVKALAPPMGGLDTCAYLTESGRKCAVGLFIPEGHPGQTYAAGVQCLLSEHVDLNSYMPLPIGALCSFQRLHDEGLNFNDPINSQLNTLLEWVDEYVADPLPSADVDVV